MADSQAQGWSEGNLQENLSCLKRRRSRPFAWLPRHKARRPVGLWLPRPSGTLKINRNAVFLPIAITRRAELLVILYRSGIGRRIIRPMVRLFEVLCWFAFAHLHKMRALAHSFKHR